MCYLTQRDAVKWIKNFFGVKDVKAAQQKLERLLREEERAVGAQILDHVDSERIPSTRKIHSIDYPPYPRHQSNRRYVQRFCWRSRTSSVSERAPDQMKRQLSPKVGQQYLESLKYSDR